MSDYRNNVEDNERTWGYALLYDSQKYIGEKLVQYSSITAMSKEDYDALEYQMLANDEFVGKGLHYTQSPIEALKFYTIAGPQFTKLDEETRVALEDDLGLNYNYRAMLEMADNAAQKAGLEPDGYTTGLTADVLFTKTALDQAIDRNGAMIESGGVPFDSMPKYIQDDVVKNTILSYSDALDQYITPDGKISKELVQDIDASIATHKVDINNVPNSINAIINDAIDAYETAPVDRTDSYAPEETIPVKKALIKARGEISTKYFIPELIPADRYKNLVHGLLRDAIGQERYDTIKDISPEDVTRHIEQDREKAVSRRTYKERTAPLPIFGNAPEKDVNKAKGQDIDR